MPGSTSKIGTYRAEASSARRLTRDRRGRSAPAVAADAMGKQKGDGARSKTRPSSSNLAASLLQSETTGVGFGGYVGSTRIDMTSTTEQSTLLDIDGEVAQHLRRISKKDPTTKLKALTSLSTLFRQIPVSELCQIAPAWVFEYKRLVQDNSRQVRQAAHDAMANLAFTIGRGLAPHLRFVMGAWWLGQFDPFTEVSEAAKQSFQVAFPVQEKRLEALIFCGNEIFQYLDENLKLTPQTISDKTAPIEELEEMHELVVSSSLLALASLLDVFIGTYLQRSASENGSCSDGLDLKNAAKARSGAITAAERICRTHKFFQEILKSRSSRVRSAVYQVFLSFVKYVPQVFSEGDMKIPASIVLGSFQEKDPTCHSSMWNMLLFFTMKFPEAWRAAPLQKVILPRLWCFLRRGCYGSQQASYPCLLPMLSSMPPGTISAEQFIDFFRSLWEGNSMCLNSPADQVALFRAMKECFMWTVNNASRYVEDGLCSIENFRVRLIDSIIFKLLWYDYITKRKSYINNGAVVDKDGALVTKSIQTTAQNIQVKPLPNYPKSFVQELGNYIIEILSSISTLDPSLLHAFSDQFQTESLKIIQLSGDGASLECNQHVDQLSEFFSLLGTCVMEKGTNWPLVYLARPFAAKSFPLIKSMGSPPAVMLLSIIISVFGPSVLPLESFVNKGGESYVQFHTEYNQECQPEVLLQFFKNNLVKWCLCVYDYSTSSRLDLLLAFLEDAYFQSQWDWIFGCAAEVENESVEEDVKNLSSDRITLLATLMEKVRYKFIDKKVLKKSCGMLGFEAKNWYSRRLDAVAVAIARRNTLKNPSCVQFLRCVLGGAEEDPVLIISKEAARLVIEELLKHLTSALMESRIAWTKYASSLILPNGIEECLQTNKASLEETLQIANFSAQVLDGSFFCLKVLDDNFEIVPHILAAPIFLDWETRMSKSGLSSSSLDLWEIDDEAFDRIDIGSAHYEGKSTDENSIDQADEGNTRDNAQEQNDIRLGFVKSVQALRSRITSFCKSFSLLSLNRLRWVLIETIRCAVLQEDVCEAQQIVVMCIEWLMEVLGYTCKDQDEEQQMLDHLLFLSDACPSWAKPPVLGESKLSTLKSRNVPSEADKNMHMRYVMFVERIGLALGKDKLLFGSLMKTSHITMENTSNPICNEISSCRIWLAIDVLCTWKWPGGSAVEYLLPFLCECAKKDAGHPQQIMVNSIINILFTGALTNSALDNFYPLNAWPISDKEVDKIEEPFLRALVMLLVVLFKDGSVWTKADASRLFHYFQKKEFQNASAVNGFTRIIPHILQILVPILRKRTVNLEETNQDFSLAEVDTGNVQENTCQWLERALSGPPLILCQMGQPDVEEWVRVAVSCFPFSSVGGMATLVMASAANISTQERELLLALFQKQASQEAISGYHALAAERRASLATVSNRDIRWEHARELGLARLMAVAIGYCWQAFGEHEWVFVLAQLRKWLESVVGHMEELAEGIHDATRVEVDHTIEYVEKIVNGSRDFPMDLAETCVFIFGLLFGLQNLDGAVMTSSLNSLKAVNWERAEIRAFEDILRLFFATGLAESIASSSCSGKAAGAVIALSRQHDVHFWENVAAIVLCAPSRAREAAMRAADLWGLRKGGINALYAILFSVYPISSLQWAAYNFLSTDPVQPFGVTKEVLSSQSEESTAENGEADQTTDIDSSSEEPSFVRAELHSVLQTPPSELLESHLTADNRVRYLLAWSLFLTRLQAVPSLSAARERMVQYIQDFGSPSTLLDILFQHIPLKQSSSPGLKKKGNAAVIEATNAATAARQSAATNSLSFAVEALWPIGIEEMATLAGAVYGLMLRVLPTYVRDWFTSLRDRSAAFSIEAFTTAWCSPQLLADEFSQIQAAGIADDTLSIKANRSSREVTAIYKKEEAGMDVVIRLPSCYPLRAVDVECTRKLGVSENRLRKWMLSMVAFVRNQNGAIAEAVHIWKRNIDREFEGVEECPICYSIIHTTNHGLPRLACKTCRHKFHSACLYKWFSTSHKSTCPLCQTPF